jgi:hypothetical protein
MKSLYILLTQTGSIVSKIVRLFSGAKYTHSAISLNREMTELYSSARKNGFKMFPAGPCKESLSRGFYSLTGRTPCVLYELSVTNEVYEKAEEIIKDFIERENEFKFSVLGIAACKFGLKWERKNKYFCSQFVAMVLRTSGAAALPKPDCLMRPEDYMYLPRLAKIYEGDIGNLTKEPALKA